MSWSVRLTYDALDSPTLGLDELCFEFWNNLRAVIAVGWPKPSQVVVTNPAREYLAFVSHEDLFLPDHPVADEGYELSTCCWIEARHQPELGYKIGRTSFLLQTAGAFPLVGGQKPIPTTDVPDIKAFVDYLDGHPMLWADRWGRKVKSTGQIRFFSHPFIQSHFLIPTVQT